MRSFLLLSLGLFAGCDVIDDLQSTPNDSRPRLTLQTPRDGAQVAPSALSIRAKVEDSDTTEDMTVQVFSDVDGLLCSGGVEDGLTGGATFTCDVELLSEGDHVIRVVAEDHGGRTDDLTADIVVISPVI